MKFKEIASRLTGFSVPMFGMSWNPPESEIAAARRVLAYLEDRRLLFNPYQLEVKEHCIHSVNGIRECLTEEIGKLPSDSKLVEHLRGIRAACRKFVDDLHPTARKAHSGRWSDSFHSDFLTELGALRASIGLRIAAIAIMHGLDVEGDLANTLPEYEKRK